MMAVSPSETVAAITRLYAGFLSLRTGRQVQLLTLRAFGQAGEFEDVGVTNHVFDGLSRLLVMGAFNDSSFVGRKAGSFVEQGANLALQLAFGPVSPQTFIFVKSPLPGIFDSDELEKLGPGE